MKSYEELLKSPEYWVVDFQQKIYSLVEEYKTTNNLNDKELAEALGISAKVLNKINNGNIDSITDFISVAVGLGVIPVLGLKSTNMNTINRNSFSKHESQQWLKRKTKSFEGFPVETLLEMLEETTSTVNQFLGAKDSEAALGVLESCGFHNSLFLESINKE